MWLTLYFYWHCCSKLVVPEVGSLDQQRQHPLGPCEKCRPSGPTQTCWIRASGGGGSCRWSFWCPVTLGYTGKAVVVSTAFAGGHARCKSWPGRLPAGGILASVTTSQTSEWWSYPPSWVAARIKWAAMYLAHSECSKDSVVFIPITAIRIPETSLPQESTDSNPFSSETMN